MRRLGEAAQVRQEGNRHVGDLQGQGSQTHGDSLPSLSLSLVLFKRKGSVCHHVSLLVSMLAEDEAVCLSVLLLVKFSPKPVFSGALSCILCVFSRESTRLALVPISWAGDLPIPVTTGNAQPEHSRSTTDARPAHSQHSTDAWPAHSQPVLGLYIFLLILYPLKRFRFLTKPSDNRFTFKQRERARGTRVYVLPFIMNLFLSFTGY